MIWPGLDMARSKPFAIIGFAMLASCTTQLETRHGLSADALASTPMASGAGKLQLLSYYVPAAQFKITVKTRAAACTAGTVTTSEIRAAVETQYNPGERFSIDYDQLSAFTKITSVSTALYPNGTLKSVNAEASDQTIETATAAVKLVATVAALAGKPEGATGDPRCAALAKREAAEAPLKAAKDKVNAAIAELLVLPPDPDTAEATGKKLDGLVDIRDAIVARLTAIDGTGWQSADALWPASAIATVTLNQDETIHVGGIDLHVMLARIEEPSTVRQSFAAPDAGAASFAGLVWRQGYRSKLTIAWCGTGLADGDEPRQVYASCPGGIGTKGSVLISTVAVVPQAGPFFLIPLRNQIGRNNTIGATFLQDGTIETASYGDKVAVGNHIATATSDLVTAASGLAPSQSAKLAAQKSCLDAVDGLRKSQAALADVLGNKATDGARFADYAAKCVE